MTNPSDIFTNQTLRNNLKIAKTTAQRYLNNWLDTSIIKKIHDKETQTYNYQIINVKAYQELEHEIENVLNKIITTIENRTTEPLPNHQEIKPPKATPTKKKTLANRVLKKYLIPTIEIFMVQNYTSQNSQILF